MRIWKKISLIFIVDLMVIVCVCSSILLIYSKNSILEMTYSQINNKHNNLAVSFGEMASYYHEEDDSVSARDALIRYCFSRYADDTSVLLKDGKTLYSGVTIHPDEYLLLDGDKVLKDTTVTEIMDRNIYIVGRIVTVGEEDYYVYVVEDITTVHNSIKNVIVTFVFISSVCVVMGVLITAFLVRKSTIPISKLAEVSVRIADGEYSMRAQIDANNEIGELANDLNRMADAIETHIDELTEKTKRQELFIAGVTHEFKTPLTALLLHSRLLRTAYMSEEEKDNSLEHIENQAQWLDKLVQSLLKLTAQEKEIEKQDVLVSELFENVNKSVSQMFNAKGTSLETMHNDERLHVNKELMQSLLVNLVDNAAKSYDPNVHGVVLMKAIDKTITIEDYGRGIPRDALSRIFEPFYMVDKSRSKKNGGCGLGLALVKKIADSHGASLVVESEEGKGTRIHITLP